MNIVWSDREGTLFLSVDGKQGNVPSRHRDEALRIIKGAQDGQVTQAEANRLKGFLKSSALPSFSRAKQEVVRAGKEHKVSDREVVESLRKAGVDNISVREGEVVSFAGRPINPAIGRHIARMVKERKGDLTSINWGPFANFLLRVGGMPAKNREHLMRWLSAHDFTLLSDGRILAYKSVSTGYKSTYAGRGSWRNADGEEHPAPYEEDKYLEYHPGNTVYMRREDVDPDSHRYCSTGLHFGTETYASGYHRSGRMVLVLVAPEDVVSVPIDEHDQKARACEMYVLCDWDRRHRIDVTSVHVEGDATAPKIFSTVGGEKELIERKGNE